MCIIIDLFIFFYRVITQEDPLPSHSQSVQETTSEGLDESDKVPREEEVYKVEKIINRRIKDGIVEYRIKWLGYDSSENTWEPEENLDCIEIVEEFLEAQSKGELDNYSNNGSEPEDDQVKDIENVTEDNNMEVSNDVDVDLDCDLDEMNEEEKRQCLTLFYEQSYNKEPETIIGVTDACGELMFLVRWKNSDTADLVPATIANEKWPQLVIKFYEDRIIFEGINL